LYTAVVGWIMLGVDFNNHKIIDSESGGNWHMFIIACACPVLVTLFLSYWYLPESPIYLLHTHQFAALYGVLQRSINPDYFSDFTADSPVFAEGLPADNCPPKASADKQTVNFIKTNLPFHIVSEGAMNIQVSVGPGSIYSTGSSATGVNSYNGGYSALMSGLAGDSFTPTAVTTNATAASAHSPIAPIKEEIDNVQGVAMSNVLTTGMDKHHDVASIEQNNISAGRSSNNNNSCNNSSCTHSSNAEYIFNVIYLVVIWFTLSFGSYGIIMWINVMFNNMHIFNAYGSSFLFSIANIPGNWFSYYYVEIYGRRTLLSWGMFISAVAAVGFAVSSIYQVKLTDQESNEHDSSKLILTNTFIVCCAMLYSACSTMAWNSLDTMSVEAFPASVRPTTMGCLAAVGRMGAIIAQVACSRLHSHVFELLMITSALMFIGGISSRMLPDATGKVLSLQFDTSASDGFASSEEATGDVALNPLNSDDNLDTPLDFKRLKSGATASTVNATNIPLFLSSRIKSNAGASTSMMSGKSAGLSFNL
jgi:MFS family permease